MRPKRYFFTKPLVKRMTELGIKNQTELARKAGIDQSILSRFFRRRSCSEETIDRLCSLLQVDKERIRDWRSKLKQAALFDEHEGKLFYPPDQTRDEKLRAHNQGKGNGNG